MQFLVLLAEKKSSLPRAVVVQRKIDVIPPVEPSGKDPPVNGRR